MKVDVYRNLNDQCYSVRSRESEDYGTVIEHVQRATLRDVEFVVQPAGRQRVLDEGRKNVHAFVRGKRDRLDFFDREAWICVRYNPYHAGEFRTVRTDEPVDDAEVAIADGRGVWVPQ